MKGQILCFSVDLQQSHSTVWVWWANNISQRVNSRANCALRVTRKCVRETDSTEWCLHNSFLELRGDLIWQMTNQRVVVAGSQRVLAQQIHTLAAVIHYHITINTITTTATITNHMQLQLTPLLLLPTLKRTGNYHQHCCCCYYYYYCYYYKHTQIQLAGLAKINN